jgi:hypothetical protein
MIFYTDGCVPTRKAETEKPASAAAKVRALQAAGEDFEWYPTTDEILAYDFYTGTVPFVPIG